MSLDKLLAYAQSQGSSLILSSLLPDGFTCHPVEDRETRMARVLAFAQELDSKPVALAETQVRGYEREEHGRREEVQPHLEAAHRALSAAYEGSFPHPASWTAVSGHLTEAEGHLGRAGLAGDPEVMLHTFQAAKAASGVARKRGTVLADRERSEGVRAHADALRQIVEQRLRGGERRVASLSHVLALAEVAVKEFTRQVRGKTEVVRPHQEMRAGGNAAGAAAGAAGRAAGQAAWEAGRQNWPHPPAVGGHKVQAVYTHPQTGNALYDLGNGLHAEGVPGKGGQFKPGAVMKSNTGLQKPALAEKGWKRATPPKPAAGAGNAAAGAAGARPVPGAPGAAKPGSAVQRVTGIKPGQQPKAGKVAKRIQSGLALQQQDYMQRHGFNIDPKDWHQDWVPPHEDRINPDLHPSGDMKDLAKPGREGAEGTAADPIDVKGDIGEALRQLASGKHVRLNRPSELTLMMQAIAQHAAETEATGSKEDPPDWDFGRLSVKGTNLFAAQSKGIRRINMPQFSGLSVPGSHAAQVAGGDGKFADLTDEFEQHLKDKGIGVSRTTMPASHLKATQSELVGAKVAGFANAFLHGNPKAVKAMSEPIMVTKDGYVIDGHHRWGANMLVDAVDGKLGNDAPMNVRKVDMEIGAMIPYANHWAQMNGIQSAAASAADTGAALGGKTPAPAKTAAKAAAGKAAGAAPKA